MLVQFCFYSFVQYQEINVQIGGSANSSDTPKRKSKFSLTNINDQPPDLIPIDQIANSAKDITMINDISEPFNEVTPEPGLELHSNDSSPVRSYDHQSPQKYDEEVAERISDGCNDEVNNLDESLSISSDEIKEDNAKKSSVSIIDLEKVEHCSARTPIKTDVKTPKSALKLTRDSNVIEAMPAYIRVSTRASMTPDTRKSPKTRSEKKKILNESTNIISQLERRNNSNINLTAGPIFSTITPPRRYSERIISTRRNSELVPSRRSEVVNIPIQTEQLQNQTYQPILTDSVSSKQSVSPPGSLQKSSSGSSLAVLINDANITRRRSQKPGAPTPIQLAQNADKDIVEEDIVVDEDVVLEDDVEYSSGSSSCHYDSDRENVTNEQRTILSGIETLEKSVLESPSRNVPVNYSQLLQEIDNSVSSNADEMYHSLSDREDGEDSEIFSSETSISHVDNNENVDPRELTDFIPTKRGIKRSRSEVESPHISGNRIKRRQPSTNDLTDLEAIKDLLDIPPDAQPTLFNESTHYESIKDLLDIPTQSEDSSVDGKTSITPRSDLTQNRESMKGFVMPKSPQNKEEGMINSIVRTPRTQNRISRTPKTPQKIHQTVYKDTPRPPPPDTTPILRRSLRTPKPRKSPGCDSPDHKDVTNLSKTPSAQKTPKRKLQISRCLSEVKAVKGILKTPTNRNRSLSENMEMDTQTPKLQKILPKTPKSQNNSLGNVMEVKQEQKTPKPQKSPKKSLGDAKGVKAIATTPKPQSQAENALADLEKDKRFTLTPKRQKSPATDLNDVREIKGILKPPKIQNEPNNDLTDVRGVKKLLATPKLQKPPKNDLSDVAGVKSILKTPKIQNPPKNDLSDIKGVKKLMATPKAQNPPRNDLSDLKGIRALMRTPGAHKEPNNDLSDVQGVKKLMATPKTQKTPHNDLTDIKGVKKLMATPKKQNPPKNDLSDVRGVKKLMSTPIVQRAPTNDLTDVRGVKTLLKTPKVQNQPKNDLSNVHGVKKLLATPRSQKSPKNDLTDVRGVKQMFSSLKSPKNDLNDVEGVNKLMKTPKPAQKAPKNDLSDVRGVKQLFAKQKEQKLPQNDLTDVRGVKDLFKILEDNTRSEIDYEGLKEMFRNDSILELENDDRDPFDKLIDRKSYRTYKGKSVSPKEKEIDISKHNVSPLVLEWVQDQSKRLENVEKEEPVKVQSNKTKSTRSNGRSKRKLKVESETETSTVEDAPQRPVRRTRRNAAASNNNDQQEEIASIAAVPSTRSRRARNKKNDESEVVDDTVSVRSTRSREKRRKVEVESSEDNDDNVSTAIRGKDKRNSAESSIVEVNLTVPKTRNRRRLIKSENDTEEIFKTPNSTKHTSTPLKAEDKKEESSDKPTKRPTRKAAKNTRAKKQVVVDESDELTGEDTKTIETSSSNHSLHELDNDKSAATRSTRTRNARAKAIQEDASASPPKTRGGKSKQKVTDENISSNKKNTKSTKKRTLYDPEYEATSLNVSKESVINDAQYPLKKGRGRTNRNVNLPRMLQEFEHNLSKNTKTENKTASKSGRAKRKAVFEEAEPEPVGRVTRSKRTKT